MELGEESGGGFLNGSLSDLFEHIRIVRSVIGIQ